MAVYADNNVYLKIDNVEVQAKFKKVDMDMSTDGKDSSAGAGIDWTEMTPGLNTIKLSAVVEYDVDTVDDYIQHIAAGQVVSIEYGPEGATSGKRRHVQDFLIETIKFGVNVDKEPVAFDISAKSSGAPSVNMYAGGKYS